MPIEKHQESPRPTWIGAIATAAIASIINFLVLPLWYLIGFAFGSTDSAEGSGIFAACTPDSTTCTDPDYGFIALAIAALIGLSAAAGKLGQMLGRTTRQRKVFFQFWLLAALVMGLEAWIFIF